MAALSIGAPFLFEGENFLDSRQGFAGTLNDLKNWNTSIPEGFEVYVKSERSWYQYQPRGNYDPESGYFIKRDKVTEKANTREDLEELAQTASIGTVAYVEDEDAFVYLNSQRHWVSWGVEDFHVGPDEPKDKSSLWLDTTNQTYDTTPIIASINKAIQALQEKVNILMGLRTNGVISGSISDSTRTELINSATPEQPEDSPFDPDSWDDSEEIPDYPSGEEPTVNHISIKMGTWVELQKNIRNFINGELIWCTDKTILYIYNNGVLYAVSKSGSDTEDDMTDERVNELIDARLGNVESIGFIPVGETTAQYTAKVNQDGVLVVYKNGLDNHAEDTTEDFYYNKTVSKEGLVINSFYLGGANNDEHSYQPCSHNFVEISNVWMDGNANTKDISLKGFYLLYLGSNTGKWKILPLWGEIPAGGTFLIRGAQCSVMDSNTTKIKVKTFDMEWRDSDGELIRFTQDKASFYLCRGTEDGKFYELGNNTPVEDLSISSPLMDADNNTCAHGYIDLVGFTTDDDVIAEKSPYKLPKNKYAKDVIFRRWYLIDPVTQSNPKDGISKHNNKKYFTATYLNSANIGELCDITEFTPKASYEGKTISATRSLFLETEPNTITCTFGIQATDKEDGNGATRGFCWNSVGYFDEFLMYRKKGTENWIKVESIKPELTNTEYISALPEGVSVPGCIHNQNLYKYFMRQRWETCYGQSVTTHKVLISGLTSGTYEYKVVRDEGVKYRGGYEVISENYTYTSKVREFTVRSDSQVTSFNFVQTTDQQGANWEEYEVWNLSARMIAKAESDGSIPNYDFTINTGDICYNGSRSNEWIDYYRGYEPLDNKEEMLCIGNNDLAPISMRDIGNGKESPWKINTQVIDYFYTVEIDSRNPQVFTGVSAKDDSIEVEYKIPGMYSFNYGQFHFVCLVSEMRTISNSSSYDPSSSNPTYDTMAQSTVNAIFGIKDVLRGDGRNLNASAIYDVEEEWLIKDLILWKGGDISNFQGREVERYNPAIVDNCSKCFVYTHEMPFNITSQSAYESYESGNTNPRETAKAYLNRYHNYEFQRLFKLWDIRAITGGHKHTAAITGPVYDAPPGYNPITGEISGATNHTTYTTSGGSTKIEDILNDKYDSEHTTGMFDNPSSFRPFLQVLRSEFADKWEDIKSLCKEIYNNTNTAISISIGDQTRELGAKSFILDAAQTPYPKVRVEIVDKITAPSYVMCQATGFKNKSNSDLAAPIIPWEKFFIPNDKLQQQCYPFFTVYKLTQTEISVDMYEIQNMYDPGTLAGGAKAGYWDVTKIYQYKNTLEGNRDYYVGENGKCTLVLFNNTAGQGETPKGTSINLT